MPLCGAILRTTKLHLNAIIISVIFKQSREKTKTEIKTVNPNPK
jgi:hypothetical protein